MKCPVCPSVDLHMSDRQGVEIDYCPNCRGVWLDRGELDKLIERSSASIQPAQPVQAATVMRPTAPSMYPPHQSHQSHQSQHHQRTEQHRYENERDYRARKKKSFLGEIFDFD